MCCNGTSKIKNLPCKTSFLQVEMVINYDICTDIHTSLHRVGRSGEASDVEVDNIENYGDVIEAMLLLGATPNVDSDENAFDDDYIDCVYIENIRKMSTKNLRKTSEKPLETENLSRTSRRFSRGFQMLSFSKGQHLKT